MMWSLSKYCRRRNGEARWENAAWFIIETTMMTTLAPLLTSTQHHLSLLLEWWQYLNHLGDVLLQLWSIVQWTTSRHAWSYQWIFEYRRFVSEPMDGTDLSAKGCSSK